MNSRILFLFFLLTAALPLCAERVTIYPGQLWLDTEERVINAHGGGMLLHRGTYYWFGEHKSAHSNSALEGITCYSSTNLVDWTSHGIALAVTDSVGAPLERGCVMERPKVIYCEATGEFVMYFHLELKNRGYAAAECGVAVSSSPTGPYRLISHGRVNPGVWPSDLAEANRSRNFDTSQAWWTDAWRSDVADGMIVSRDLEGGQMARDQQLFVDDDGKAYHIYSSEENLTLHIAELTADYRSHTGKYVRVDPCGHNEAPALFKHNGTYYMITSGCTGWAPNAARLFTAPSILGPWTRHGNPCRGSRADVTFGGQSTYILPLPDGSFLFMADVWHPENPIDGRYLWLPIEWGTDGLPQLHCHSSFAIEI